MKSTLRWFGNTLTDFRMTFCTKRNESTSCNFSLFNWNLSICLNKNEFEGKPTIKLTYSTQIQLVIVCRFDFKLKKIFESEMHIVNYLTEKFSHIKIILVWNFFLNIERVLSFWEAFLKTVSINQFIHKAYFRSSKATFYIETGMTTEDLRNLEKSV